nr:hypothetical protein [Glycomyces buryatensis]
MTRITVDHLPHDGSPKPVWLWTSAAGLSEDELDGIWAAWLRRFDIEHTFRYLKQTLGWTTPRPRTPAQADVWTWLVIAVFAQLGLARTLVADLRLPWEAPAEPGKLTPARVRRGFGNLRQELGSPARAPKPSRPGSGRPKGRRNTQRAPVYDPGKTTKRDRSLSRREQRTSPRLRTSSVKANKFWSFIFRSPIQNFPELPGKFCSFNPRFVRLAYFEFDKNLGSKNPCIFFPELQGEE